MEKDVLSQLHILAQSVTDFRTGNHQVYSSTSIVFMSLVGVLCGAKGWTSIELVCKSKEGLLKSYLGEDFSGVPSHDCIRYFFRLLNPKQLESTFRDFMASVKRPAQAVIAVDGKTERAASGVGKSTGSESKLHIISAFVTEIGISLGQVAVGEKKNEIVEIPVLLKELEIKGDIITIDAMGCQKKIAETIIEKKADYIFQVKENQSNLLTSLKEGCEKQIGKRTSCYEFASKTSQGHSRIEKRSCFMCNFLGWLPKCGNEWPGIKSFGCVTTFVRNITTRQETTEKHYFISSLPLNAELAMDSIRKHWGIENNLHWQLDVSFGEDSIRLDKKSMMNLSVLNKIALPILKKHPAKLSIANKMMKAAMNNIFLEELIDYTFDTL